MWLRIGSQAHTLALHMLPAITSEKKGQLHLCPNRSDHPCRHFTRLVKFSSSFFLNMTPHGLCFPSFNSVQDVLTPRPIVASKENITYTCSITILLFTLHDSVNLHVPPPSLVCILHPLDQADLRPSCSIHGVILKPKTWNHIRCCPVRVLITMSSFTSWVQVLVHRGLAGFGSMSHLSASLIRSFIIFTRCGFE